MDGWKDAGVIIKFGHGVSAQSKFQTFQHRALT